jgi:ATP-binding cassette subfamily F protein 3
VIVAQAIAKRWGPQLLFEGLHWQIQPRRRYGLVGPNGAGKTTLLRILVGELPPDGGSVLRPRGVTIGYLPQDVERLGDGSVLGAVLGGLPGWTQAKANLAAVHGRLSSDHSEAALVALERAQEAYETAGGDAVEVRAKQALGGLGFTREAQEQPAAVLSGGWKMRAALARLLVLRPDVLLLDEPTNHLDFESLAWFEGFLEDYEGAVVAVSHDRYFLNRMPTHVVELTKKGVHEYPGGYDDFIEGRAERLAQLQARKAQVDRQRAHLQSFVDRFRAKASKAKQAQSRMKMLAKLENVELDDGQGTIGLRLAEPARTAKAVIETEHVRKSWGETKVYDDLGLTIWRGDKVALVGPNGAGKSTLLKVLAGVTEIQGGEVRLGGGVQREWYAQHQLETLDPASTVYESARRAAKDETVPIIRKTLGALGFSGQAVDKRVAVLSGGEKARVALACMALRAPNVLLLDEPTNHLDLTSREVLEDALTHFPGTVVIVSHDRYFINAVATKVLEVLPGGQVTEFQGDYDAYLYRKAGGDPALIEALLRGEQPDDKADPSAAKQDDRSRKREEAERRQELSRRVKPLRERLTSVEGEVAAHEKRLHQIAEAQLDPNLYADGERVRALATEQAELQRAVTAAMDQWESLSLRIEAIEAEVNGGA